MYDIVNAYLKNPSIKGSLYDVELRGSGREELPCGCALLRVKKQGEHVCCVTCGTQVGKIIGPFLIKMAYGPRTLEEFGPLWSPFGPGH